MRLAVEAALCLQSLRMVPWAITNFKLNEIASVVDLRRQVNNQFKRHMHMKDPKVRSCIRTAENLHGIVPGLQCLRESDASVMLAGH